jgi:hypothetical protein
MGRRAEENKERREVYEVVGMQVVIWETVVLVLVVRIFGVALDVG